ncbi:MAG TPA: hypothetical protein VGM54_23365 [Chthoniobacter sp.]|jgi:hypothetical protein
MADDFYGYDEDELEPKGRDNLFLWTVFILLLIGAAFACWMGSFYVFGHPEKPKAYALLLKLHKIEPPLRFEVTAAPPGEFLNPQKLYERFSKFKRLELEQENGELIRNYIRNYRETKKLTTYVTGRYVVVDSRDLKPSDMFPTGVVTLAQAEDFPQVLIEQVYTAAPRTVQSLRNLLQTGFEIRIQHTNDRYDCSAVIHAESLPEGRMLFTVVPILYGSYAMAQGTGTFSLEPPPTLNMVPGLPVFKTEGLDAGMKKFASYRHDHPLPSTEPGLQPPPNATPKPELVRVDTVQPGKEVPATGPMPAVPTATPVRIAGQATPRPIGPAAPTPISTHPQRFAGAPTPISVTPIQVTRLMTPSPRATPYAAVTPIPGRETPLPTTSPDGVHLERFMGGTPALVVRRDAMRDSTAAWRTYAPGQAPPAKTVSLDEVGALADRGEVNERLYLKGEFRVTASGTSRAVLRDATRPDDQSPRIVVEYPPGDVPPQERERFTRDSNRPYQVSDVRRGADGVITIYVREIINQ